MANIMELFAHKATEETKFDISGLAEAYERIAAVQAVLGGKPTLKAKVGSGGVKVFTITNGNREIVTESFKGVILAHHSNNALFEVSGENMNTPPICSSVDGVCGINHKTGEVNYCERCPYNEYGTAGNGKACKNMHRLYILVEGSPIPVTLSLPPTSLELWRNYALMDVAAAGFELSQVVTEFSLTNAVNEVGQKYSIVNFRLVGTVNQEVTELCNKMSVVFEQSPRMAITGDDYNRELDNVLVQSEYEAPVLEDIIDSEAYENPVPEVESEPEEIDIDSL